jgi:hypothetical protein
MRLFLSIVLVFVAIPAFAQVQSRPSDPPIVTAANDAWFVRGDPVQFAGNNYYRAGASVFFDGNRMVRTGQFNGVPLYADTTIEPFSMVFVPIGRGLMAPYELPRSGDLAGTTGSHAPSFPVSALPSGWSAPMAPSAPTNLAFDPIVGLDSPVKIAPAIENAKPVRVPETVSEEEATAAIAPPVLRPAIKPADLQAARQRIWVEYRGQKWASAGPAIPLQGSGLVQTGEYAGFAVFTRNDGLQDGRIYLPALPGLVAPYQMKP